MKISLIVPCYNEEAALPYFLKEIKKTEAELQNAYGCRFELIFINDGSKDNTLSVLRDFAKNDPSVRYLSFSRNFGKESAMYAGFCNATGDYIAVMDGSNMRNILRITRGENDGRIKMLLEYAGESSSVSDPWYSRDFKTAYNDIEKVTIHTFHRATLLSKIVPKALCDFFIISQKLIHVHVQNKQILSSNFVYFTT